MLPHEAFRSLVEHADEIIAVVDETDRVRYVNRAAETRLGYERAGLLGRLDKCAQEFLADQDALSRRARRRRRDLVRLRTRARNRPHA
jgi:PAS domain S-box-containing protein